MNNLLSSIKNGPFELINSGIFQLLEKELTTIVFDNIKINFEFTIDNADASSKILVDSSEQNAIKFSLVNITRPSYGTTEFVKFATLASGEDVYLSFRVNSLDDKNVRSLEYSIYKKNA